MTGLNATYQDVGTPMASRVLGFVIYNTSNVDAQVSFDDGATNGPIVPAGGTLGTARFPQAAQLDDARYMLPEGAQIQVKQVTGAGASGNLIVNIVRE